MCWCFLARHRGRLTSKMSDCQVASPTPTSTRRSRNSTTLLLLPRPPPSLPLRSNWVTEDIMAKEHAAQRYKETTTTANSGKIFFPFFFLVSNDFQSHLDTTCFHQIQFERITHFKSDGYAFLRNREYLLPCIIFYKKPYLQQLAV